MFFVLSKILSFLISPINWILLALAVGFISKNKRRKRRSYITAIILFFFFTNGFISNKFMSWVEVESIGKEELQGSYDAGILLGGMIVYHSDSNHVNFNANGDRLFQTIDLYTSGRIDKIIITSGSGLMQMRSFKESYLIKKYLVNIGLPEEDILIETNSRNTHENAVETAKLLDSYYGNASSGKYLLITSASHMRRARGCFKKQGIDVVAYSTTKRSAKGRVLFESEMILPSPGALLYWKTINHEIVGLMVYRMKGYI